MTAPTWCRNCGDPEPKQPHTCEPYAVWWHKEGKTQHIAGENLEQYIHRKTSEAWKGGAAISETVHDELIAYRQVLQKIAAEDYGGSRHTPAIAAHEVLRRFTR